MKTELIKVSHGRLQWRLLRQKKRPKKKEKKTKKNQLIDGSDLETWKQKKTKPNADFHNALADF